MTGCSSQLMTDCESGPEMVSNIACILVRPEYGSHKQLPETAAEHGCAKSKLEILSERIGSNERDREPGRGASVENHAPSRIYWGFQRFSDATNFGTCLALVKVVTTQSA